MKKSQARKFEPLTAERVIAHAAFQRSKGRAPSLSFCGISNPRKALQSALLVERIAIAKAPQMSIFFGFECPEFTIRTLLLSQRFPVRVRNEVVDLQLNFGLLQFKTESVDLNLKKTYLAEIDTRTPALHHAYNLPLSGFGSYIFQDYAEAGRELVRRFSEALGLRIYTELNHWPNLKIVVAN
jgi:hypothetical protein